MSDREIYEVTATEAVERYHKDVRFRANAQSVVHHAMQDHMARNPEADWRESERLALDVATVLMERLFNEDAELGAQRAIADQYRKLAEEALSLQNRPPLIPIVAPVMPQERSEPA